MHLFSLCLRQFRNEYICFSSFLQQLRYKYVHFFLTSIHKKLIFVLSSSFFMFTNQDFRSFKFLLHHCVAPGRVYTTGPQLHLDLPGQQKPVLLLWTYLHILQRLVLHFDASTLQRPVMLKLSRQHYRDQSCTWTCLDNSSKQEVSTLQGLELHLDMYTPQGSELLWQNFITIQLVICLLQSFLFLE